MQAVKLSAEPTRCRVPRRHLRRLNVAPACSAERLQLLDQIFNLKFTSKQLVRAAKKCEKEEKDEKLKIKKAIEKGARAKRRLLLSCVISPEVKLGARAERLPASVASLTGCCPQQSMSRTNTQSCVWPSFYPCRRVLAGNMDGARIYGQNAIRKKNEALNYLRLGSRLDAVVSRLDQQAKMQVGCHCWAG